MKDKADLLIENFQIEEVLGSIVNRAAIIIRKRFTVMMKEAGYDITPEEFALLSRLWEQEGISQKVLVEKTLKDKTRVARLLGALIEKEYVHRRFDETDRRNYIVYVTEKGKALRLIAIPVVTKLMEQAAEGIEQHELDITKKVLKKVFANLNAL